MADPKIRYDIEAGIQGEADVAQLAQTVRRLGDTLEDDLKVQAEEAANALEQLGAKRDAVAAFQRLNNESGALAIELAEAEGKVRALSAGLPEAASAAQRFALAEGEARSQLDRANDEMKAQRTALATLKSDYTGAARNTDEYRNAQAALTARIKELRSEIALKKTSLAAAASESTAAATAEKKLGAEYTAAGLAAVKAGDAVRSNTTALASSRGALQAFGIATDNAAQAERNLEQAIGRVRERVVALAPAFAQAAAASSTSAQRQVSDHERIQNGLQGIRNQLQTIQTIASVAVGGSFVTGLIKGVVETADDLKNLQARIQLVTGAGEGFQTAFKGVTEVALATHSPLNETGTLFSKLAKAGTDAGLGAKAAADQSLDLTKTINQAIQLSGASAEASGAAITQLIQGLQSGVLRGDEFNSVMEQAPRLAQALADGLGRSTGELRKMAEQGGLTSSVVIQALTSQAAAVEKEFAKLPTTVGRSIQDLQTQWMLLVGASDSGFASSTTLARGIDLVTKNLDTLVTGLYAAGKAWAAIKIAGIAADVVRWATATTGATAAVAANTTAVAANTTAQVANAAAGRASAASASAQATAVVANTQRIQAAGSVLGRFGVLLGPVGIGLAAITPQLIDLGQSLGEGIAKWQGYGKVMEDAEAKARMQEEVTRANATQQRLLATALEESRNKQFELSKQAEGVVSSFDAMRNKGDSAADAIKKIGKDFDLSNVKGIRDAGGVLDKLRSDAKITAEEFREAFAVALKGEDLLLFETRARAAFAGSAREAERMAAVLDVTAREAIRRAGLDFDLISLGMGNASRSAINDVDTLISAFDRLKAQGVDVGQALSASLSKGIDTADGQKSLDLLIQQIESVRSKLGDTLADGLLDQANRKSEALATALAASLPGIQSVSEAMKNLGVTTEKALKDTAAESKKSYDFLVASGQASARELTLAFTKYATDVITANNGVATDALRTEAAIRKVGITADASGKAMVGALGEAKRAAAETEGGFIDLGNAGRLAGAQTVSAMEQANSAQERLNKTVEKSIELENQRRGVDSSGFAANAKGDRIVAGSDLTTLTGVTAFLKAAGVGDENKAREIAKEFANKKGEIVYMDNPGQKKYGGETISVALLKAAERLTFGIGGNGTPAPGSTVPLPESTRTVNLNLNLNGRDYGSVSTTSAGADALQAMLADLQSGKARAA